MQDTDTTALLNILIANTERVMDQNEKLADRVGEIDITLARLTDTVEVHEKRSNSLESIQKSCQNSCQTQITSALKMAQEAQQTWASMRSYYKTLAVLLGVLFSIVSLIAGVTQILEYVAKK